MMREDTDIPGCFILRAAVMNDARGRFAKTFVSGTFASFAVEEDWREEIHSTSHRDVLRGMHFQIPPAQHAKLVSCVAGEVLDVVVDLRQGSPTFLRHRSFVLSADNGLGLYIPAGLAHGFLSRADDSIMFYKITGAHAPEQDRGIAWNSFGFAWPVEAPIISERDQRHPPLAEYDSPFLFGDVS